MRISVYSTRLKNLNSQNCVSKIYLNKFTIITFTVSMRASRLNSTIKAVDNVGATEGEWLNVIQRVYQHLRLSISL